MHQLHAGRKPLGLQQADQTAVHLDGQGASGDTSDGPGQIAQARADLDGRIPGLEADQLDDLLRSLRGAQEVLPTRFGRSQPMLGQLVAQRPYDRISAGLPKGTLEKASWSSGAMRPSSSSRSATAAIMAALSVHRLVGG